MSYRRLLQHVDFDEKTEKVYLALLRLADSPATKIAKESGLKRTSVYHVLENLVSRGLASTYTHRGTKRYAAESPTKIKALFEQKAILADRLMPMLQQYIDENRGSIQFNMFDTTNGLRSLNEEALNAKEKNILTIGSSKKLLQYMGGKFGFGERRRKQGILMRSLRCPGDEPSTNHRLHQVRFLPDVLNFPGYIIIFDDTVGIILFENKGLGFLINSKSFAQIMKTFFETLWLQCLDAESAKKNRPSEMGRF